ncbi:hypothetical protein GH714_040333 [Hevea brasiliensis]|uniref:BAG domain-containing protein n=1 Tax=Hevea brasiliensis TaxID=3981 RepID=A0A6A6MT94_HEVBR|nr:hypothetical protein GH714_040333 [Hevea brasiliensis]
MSRIRRIEILEPYYPSIYVSEVSIFTPKIPAFPSFVIEEEPNDHSVALDLLSPKPNPFELFDSVSNLIQIEKAPSFCSYKRIQTRGGTEMCLQTLCGRVSSLESRFDSLINAKVYEGDRKFTWTAEVKRPLERKSKWTAEIKEGRKNKEEKKAGVEKNYKWIAEMKGKEEEHPISRKYTFEVSSGDAGECSGSGKKEKKDKKEKKVKKGENVVRLVEIEEPHDHGVLALRQLTFRAYLIRRSKALRALRELAIAKAKLKEIRALFNNFSYRRQVARDAEERQRFSEKIIVLLLTVVAIEGPDLMARAAKKSMVDELEAMLDVVDTQPPGKLLSMKRRTFDMPDGVIRKETA